MRQFEYTVLEIATKFSWRGAKLDLQDLSSKLNDLGKQGWEIVNTTDFNAYDSSSSGLVIILKREL